MKGSEAVPVNPSGQALTHPPSWAKKLLLHLVQYESLSEVQRQCFTLHSPLPSVYMPTGQNHFTVVPWKEAVGMAGRTGMIGRSQVPLSAFRVYPV